MLAYKKYAESLSVSFGSGGGFTGAVDEFILNGNGALKSIKPFTKDTILLKTLAKKDLKTIFKTLESKSLSKIKLDSPGNMTNFITFSKAGKIVQKYQWSQGTTVPNEINQLFTLLNKHTQQ
jgi:hypothetical protein